MKMISVDYPTFHGFVYYTGIARIPGDAKDTGDHIEEWLRETSDMELFEVVEHLRLSATAFIRSLRSGDLAKRRLTIVVAVFSRDRPTAAVISNFESLDGIVSSSALPEFQRSWITLRRGQDPAVLITGNKGAVSPDERALLLALVIDAGEDARRIRTEMQAMNKRAAHHPSAKETISEECVVVSTDATNRGSLEMGDQPGLALRTIRNGADFSFSSLLESLGITGLGQLRSASFATNRSATRRPSNCKKILVDVQNSGYAMTPILDADGVNCAVLGMSSSGSILGAHALPDDLTRNRYWTWSGGDELNYLDVEESYCTTGCANGHGEIAVVVGTQKDPRVLRCDSAGQVHGQLEIPTGMSGPNVVSMSSSGAVVGSIEVTRDVTDGSRQKPTYWDADGRIQILRELFEGRGGHAVAISDAGEVLVWANYDWFGVVAMVWNPISGDIARLPGSVIPIGWAGNGGIVGFDRTQGRDAPTLLNRPKSWERISANNGFHPHAVNGHGTIAGSVTIDGYEAPWVMRRNEPALLLPTYRYHSASVRFIGDDGTAVGVLSANDEHHIVIWRP